MTLIMVGTAQVNPVVVIGAGLAGLSAACYLTGRGYDVTVVEREEQSGRPGRRLAPRRIHASTPGRRCSPCPT